MITKETFEPVANAARKDAMEQWKNLFESVILNAPQFNAGDFDKDDATQLVAIANRFAVAAQFHLTCQEVVECLPTAERVASQESEPVPEPVSSEGIPFGSGPGGLSGTE